MNRRAVLAGGIGAVTLAAAGAVLVGRRPAGSSGEAWRGEGDCGPRLTLSLIHISEPTRPY